MVGFCRWGGEPGDLLVLPSEIEELSAVSIFATKLTNLLRLSLVNRGVFTVIPHQRVVVVLLVQVPSPLTPAGLVEVALQGAVVLLILYKAIILCTILA